MPPTKIADITAAFHLADSIWQAELDNAFGLATSIGYRYSPAGHGEPGTPLRAAYEARKAAQVAFHAAWAVSNRAIYS